MSQVNPPNQYFPTIIYNSQFWTSSSSSDQYLGRTGTPTSIATNTTFTGTLTTAGISNTGSISTTDLTVTNVINGIATSCFYVYSQSNNTNSTFYLTFTDQSIDALGILQKRSTLTFNPYTEVLTAPKMVATTSMTSVTPATSNNSTLVATTAYVKNQGYTTLALIQSNNNNFSGTNSFNTSLPTSTLTPTTSTQLITKGYADATYQTSGSYASLSATQTFTGVNTFNNSFVANCPVTTGSIQLQYNGVTMIEISQYALYSPISISPDFSQISFNYTPVFRSNLVLDNGYTFGFGTSGYGAGYIVIGVGSSLTNAGDIYTNTLEPNGTSSSVSLYTTLTSSLTFGNASATLTSNFSTNTFSGSVGLASATFSGTLNSISTTVFGYISTLSSNAQTQITNIINGTTAITVNNQNIRKSSPTLVTGTTLNLSSGTIYDVYSIAITATLTITLPTITASNLGQRISFRRVGPTTTITAISSATNIYPTTSNTAQTTILASGGYSTTIFSAVLTSTPTYGWFIE